MSVREDEEEVFAVVSITKKDPCNSLADGAGMSFSANQTCIQGLKQSVKSKFQHKL